MARGGRRGLHVLPTRAARVEFITQSPELLAASAASSDLLHAILPDEPAHVPPKSSLHRPVSRRPALLRGCKMLAACTAGLLEGCQGRGGLLGPHAAPAELRAPSREGTCRGCHRHRQGLRDPRAHNLGAFLRSLTCRSKQPGSAAAGA